MVELISHTCSVHNASYVVGQGVVVDGMNLAR